ncbi:MAG TPA: aspartyl protease family protein [Chthonomonadaceae bacterium]|nr:aspartyl protease family protein [Chthonomonadaceae bacterium]
MREFCRRWVIVLLAAFLLLSTGGKAKAQQHAFTQYQIDQDIVEVPFEYMDHQILVHADTPTKKGMTFLFDTGATAPVLDRSLSQLGQFLATTRIKEADGETTGEEVVLDDLEMGDRNGKVSAHNIEALVMDLSHLSKALQRKLDGIIGISFLAGYVTEIDYTAHVLRFYNPQNYTITTRKPDGQRTFMLDLIPGDLTRPDSTLLVAGQLHPKYDYSFLLDTGFGGYISVAQSAAVESGLLKPDTPRVEVTNFGVSRAFRSDKIRAAYLTLGPLNLTGRIVQVDVRNGNKYGQNGIVGNRLLQNYRVTLDYPRRKLWLEQVTDKQEPDAAEKPSFGLQVRADGVRLRVEHVDHASPGQQSGIRPGDCILSINGDTLRTLTPLQAQHLISTPHGAITLVLQRGVDPNLGTGGDTYTLTLTPAAPVDWTTR